MPVANAMDHPWMMFPGKNKAPHPIEGEGGFIWQQSAVSTSYTLLNVKHLNITHRRRTADIANGVRV
jgi:hypothetical protein